MIDEETYIPLELQNFVEFTELIGWRPHIQIMKEGGTEMLEVLTISPDKKVVIRMAWEEMPNSKNLFLAQRYHPTGASGKAMVVVTMEDAEPYVHGLPSIKSAMAQMTSYDLSR